MHEQQREQRALLGARERQRPLSVAYLERTQDPVLHRRLPASARLLACKWPFSAPSNPDQSTAPGGCNPREARRPHDEERSDLRRRHSCRPGDRGDDRPTASTHDGDGTGRHRRDHPSDGARGERVRLRRELAMRGLTFRGPSRTRTSSRSRRTAARLTAIRSLDDAATVVDASPNYVRRALDVPDDRTRAREALFDAIRLTQAWDLSHGAGDVVIAVVDTGVRPSATWRIASCTGHVRPRRRRHLPLRAAPDPGDRDPWAVGTGRSSRASLLR